MVLERVGWEEMGVEEEEGNEMVGEGPPPN